MHPERDTHTFVQPNFYIWIPSRFYTYCISPCLVCSVNKYNRNYPRQCILYNHTPNKEICRIVMKRCSNMCSNCVDPITAVCVQRFDDSRGFAIHITYRILLRSSSLREPRYPLSRVVIYGFEYKYPVKNIYKVKIVSNSLFVVVGCFVWLFIYKVLCLR